MALPSRAFDMPAGRALEGLDLAVEILLDDTHEPRAAELVPARVQRTRVRAAHGSPRPPEHERHERARAPQRGTRQQRACGNLWREDLERGAGRRLCNALGTHVDSREYSRSQDRCSCCTEGPKEHARVVDRSRTTRRGSPGKDAELRRQEVVYQRLAKALNILRIMSTEDAALQVRPTHSPLAW